MGTKYGLSANGWINTDLFEAWFIEHFIPNAVSSRPLLLLLWSQHPLSAASNQICQGTRVYNTLPASAHDTRVTAIGCWGICSSQGPLEQGLPRFLLK